MEEEERKRNRGERNKEKCGKRMEGGGERTRKAKELLENENPHLRIL